MEPDKNDLAKRLASKYGAEFGCFAAAALRVPDRLAETIAAETDAQRVRELLEEELHRIAVTWLPGCEVQTYSFQSRTWVSSTFSVRGRWPSTSADEGGTEKHA